MVWPFFYRDAVAAVLVFLHHAGCHMGQGYLFSKPLPADAFEDWLAERLAVSKVLRAEL